MTAGPDKDKEIVIEHDDRTDLIQALLKNYELVWNRIEGSSNRIVQVVGVGFAFLGLLTTYVLSQPLTPIVFWILPSLFLPLFAYIVYNIYITTASLWNARFLSQRINFLLGEKAFIRHLSDLPEAKFFSTKRGSIKFRLIYLTVFIAVGFLFSIMLIYSFLSIYIKGNHLQGMLFALFYGLIVITLLVSCFGFLFDLPNDFDKVLNQYPNGEPIPVSASTNMKQSSKPPILNFRKVIASILPRQWDFIAKGYFFIFGLGAALIIIGIPKDVIAGLPYNHLQLINALFGTKSNVSISWNTIAKIPLWTECVLGLTYFFVEEVLLQQAKFIWDDIRDVQRDRNLLHNNTRAIAAGLLSKQVAIWQMFIRLFLALILGYFLGGIPLLAVFLLIALHQVVYVLWAKPRGGKHPVIILFVLSLNVSLRFISGVVAVVGFSLSNIFIPIILLFAIFYFYSFGGLAAFWKMEAKDCEEKKEKYPRLQSEYYLTQGVYYQHTGLLIALLLSNALFFSLFTNFGNVAIFTVIEAIILILFFVYYGKVVKAHPIAKVIKSLLSLTLLLLNYFAFLIAFIVVNKSFLLLSNLLLIANYLLLYEGMTYEEYIFENIKKKLPEIKKSLYNFLFDPNPLEVI